MNWAHVAEAAAGTLVGLAVYTAGRRVLAALVGAALRARMRR